MTPAITPVPGPLPALLYSPTGPQAPPAAGWPLVLFLHGSGERGQDLERVRLHGLPRELDQGRELPAFVLAPQCPEGSGWDTGALAALLDRVEAEFPTDPQRVLLTGLSMGGYGSWALALAQPERFAALVPVCGGGDPARAAEIGHIPQWVFHGALDEVVPPARSGEMVEALRACGAEVRFTLYPELGHTCWDRAYGEEELYSWLLERVRRG